MTTAAAILAASGVGFGHAVLPDHWVPLAVIGRTQRYPIRKVARLSGLAGAAHVLVSVVLGAVVVAVGLELRSRVEHAENAIVGSLLIATAVGFLALELSGRGHRHRHGHAHDHDHDHDHNHDHEASDSHRDRASRRRALLGVMVPFGAAASPDLTILPVFLAASTAGAAPAIAALLGFAAVTIATIVALTLLATAGGHQIRGRWLDRGGNLFTAAVLIAIGVLVLAGVL